MRNNDIPDDPYHSREQEKYQNPVPSREFVLDYLRKSEGPVTHEEICAGLGLTSDEQIEAMRRRLRAMERDGQVARNRRGGYGTLDKLNLVKGRVIGHPEGFGFVTPSNGVGDDIYLSSRQMRRVFDGDIVLVRIAGWDHRGRPEGSLVDVLERNTSQLVGRYFCESGIHFVRPDNPRVAQDVMIPHGELGNAKPGQVVAVEIIEPPSRNSLPTGRISEVLGDHLDPGLEIQVAIRNHAIPHTWGDACEAEDRNLPEKVRESDTAHRVDLRGLALVTIDGEDARDFDDAVYCEPQASGGWKLLVAIADVSHYVKAGSALDSEAFRRGNSTYFPDFVVPMLPEKLSNGLCSLNPEVERLCMVCEMRIGPDGEILRFSFYEGLMHSRARLTYTQVAQMIAERDSYSSSGIRKQFSHVCKRIDMLYELYQVLHQRRYARGAIDFDSQETRILFDAKRKISQIIPVDRTDAHRLIEECMLCANVCAAQLLQKSKIAALYRVHEGPTEEKLSALREFLGELGIGLGGGDDPQPEDYQRVLQRVAERPDSHIIQAVMLRSMSQARYQPENLGHFGLAYDAYTHFTSPIRRYADLLVHRAIRSLIRSGKKVAHVRRIEGTPKTDGKVIYPYDLEKLTQIGEQVSSTERRSDEATRDVVNWLKCEFLLDRVGDDYWGVVSAVTGFGLFVMLDELLVEGLVHVTGLPKDYYFHEAAHHRMIGERTRRVYRLGDRLHVRILRVDLQERKIDFELIEQAGEKRSKERVRVSARAREMANEYEDKRKTASKNGSAKFAQGKRRDKREKSRSDPKSTRRKQPKRSRRRRH